MPPFPAAPSGRSAWAMLLALTGAFALSQAYRTVAAIMSAQALGVFAGSFHFAFGAMQIFMGIGIDLHGVRRTVLTAFPLVVAGSALSALTADFHWLVLGQVLIGVGCAPAFLVCTVFVSRHFPGERFASISGLVLGLGGIGMLATGTPLAWLMEGRSWRAGFVALGALALAAWLAIFWLVHEPPHEAAPAGPRESLGSAVRSFGALFTVPHTLGILALAAVTYAAFITLRGLWLGPLLIERHGFSLVAGGNAVLAVSIASMVGAPLFGRIDPGPRTRRRWIVGFTLAVAVVLAVLALDPGPAFDVIGAMLVGLASGYIVLQYADVRAAYPTAMTGRAMALFTMAMFLGVALMQWLTGLVASIAAGFGGDPFVAVLAAMALLLAAGAAAFVWLPAPNGAQRDTAR